MSIAIPPHLAAQAETHIYLEGARFFEIPATQPLFHRPMQFNATSDTILQLQNATHGGDIISPLALREIASQVVAPARVPEGQLTIAEGWRISRFAVYLLFRIVAGGRTFHEVITGYTDHPDTSMSGFLADDCRIFINSHIRINEGQTFGQQGMAAGLSTAQDTNVLTPVGIIAANGQNLSGQFTQRPTDILTGWQMGIGSDSRETFDPRGVANPILNGGFGVASARNNYIPSAFLARCFKGVKDAKMSIEQFNPGVSDIYMEQMVVGAAASSASDNEKDFSAFKLFQHLQQNTSYGTTGSFSPAELFNAIGHDKVNWQAIESPRSLPKGSGGATMLLDNSHGWGDYSDETYAAHQISHAVPAVCGRNMLSTYKFKAVGSFSHNQHVCNYEYGQTLFPVNPTFEANACMRVKEMFESIIMPEIFYGKCDSYNIDVTYAIGGTINMDIQLDGRTSIPYAAPNYCDHMNAPTVAVDKQVVNNNGMIMRNIVQNVFDTATPGGIV